MKKAEKLMNIFATLSSAVVLAALGSGVMAANVIMPVGDSITKGSGGQFSYRKKLFQDWQADGCTLDMFGSERPPVLSGVWHPSNGDDTYHAGFSGRKANKVLSQIGQQITDASQNSGVLPDYVILHIGTNDILAGDAVGTYYSGISDGSTIGEINRIVDEILPHAKLLIANIIPLADFPSTPYNERTMAVDLGNQIEALVADRQTNDDIYLVDVRSGFNNGTMTLDGIHPNDAGEALMATRIRAALSARGVCGGTPEPEPEPEPEPGSTCNGLQVTVNLALGQSPTGGDDVILGTSGNDIISAYGGNDTICGLSGDDTISAGGGDDWVGAGPGSDSVLGGSGNDTIYGGPDDDLLKGGSGNDTIIGGKGNDVVKGQAGYDILMGGEDDDSLVGGSEDDSLEGGPGDSDSCNGSSGNDEADNSCESFSSIENITSGGGTPTPPGGDLTCNGLDVTVDLSLGQVPTNGNDVIWGTSGDDSIGSLSGNDTICSGNGNDVISAGNGDDWIDAGPGDDTVVGGSGNDMIYGGDDNDLLKGGSDDDYLDGEDGNDIVKGQAGNDSVNGGAGNDEVIGGKGDDDLAGDAGDDNCQGNAGIDSADSTCESVSSVP